MSDTTLPASPWRPTAEQIDAVAQAMHDHDDQDTTWPESDDDTGYRGAGGWVRLTPKFRVEEYRDRARVGLMELLQPRLGFPSPPPASSPSGEGDRSMRERDIGADYVLSVLGLAVGYPNWHERDGTDTWEGDVCATMMGILRAAKVLDPETDELATDRAERAEAQVSALSSQVEEMRKALADLLDAVDTVNDIQGRVVVDRPATAAARAALGEGQAHG